MNAPWWRLSDASRQTTTDRTDRTVRIEIDDENADLLPPFYD